MLRITFRQLEAFYWAATLGTVAAAARHLFVSQPAITARVKELEEVLGMALFSRSQQGVQLTQAGQEVLQHAQRLLAMGEELERSGRLEVPPLDGLLRLGADETSAAVAVSELLRRLRERWPSLRVDLSIERSKVLHEKMNRRELDVALHTNPVARPHVVDELVGHVQVAWVASATLEPAHVPMSPADAALLPVVTTPQPSVLHYLTRDWLGRGDAERKRLNTCNTLMMIMHLVEEGHAISAMPVPVVMEKLKSGSLKLIPSEPALPPFAYYVSALIEKQEAGAGTVVELAKSVLRSAQFFTDARAAG